MSLTQALEMVLEKRLDDVFEREDIYRCQLSNRAYEDLRNTHSK